MLILRRRVGESIIIGDGVRITVTEVRGGTVRIAIDAPAEMPVYRAELLESIGPENERALLRRSMTPPILAHTPEGVLRRFAHTPEGVLRPVVEQSSAAASVSDFTITFPSGILGLGGHREFLLYDIDDSSRMLVAKDDPLLRLLLTDPTLVDPSYPLSRAVARFPFGEEEVAVASVVTRHADGSGVTVNLAAPLLIGMSSRKAVQVILDDERLSLRAPLTLLREQGDNSVVVNL